MELEALFLGLEPLAAAVVGVGSFALGAGAIALTPILKATNSPAAESMQETARSAAKATLMLTFEALDKAQSFLAEASESYQDLVAEAREEMKVAKTEPEQEPQNVEIT
ncbi:DUF5132 domain-containing protein [Anthocerotibacter panamensis]|uniref:DUF5132 domain-containing protein n=1 Tax=Anthocerotibacter panamensis TaxID=2857077 RepID=UPI001C406363|nr:DUF5132 domain-containing protein [Anthocerotibacter panamensis]